jgi:hypothetical protein
VHIFSKYHIEREFIYEYYDKALKFYPNRVYPQFRLVKNNVVLLTEERMVAVYSLNEKRITRMAPYNVDESRGVGLVYFD